MQFLDDLLIGDLHPTGHEQTHVLDQIGGKLMVRDVTSRDVQAEILRRQSAAIGEVNDEIELNAVRDHVCLVV